MRKQIALCLALFCGASSAQENAVIDAMETPSFKATADKVVIESVDGHEGKAVQIAFTDGAKSVFATKQLRPTPAWDEANGFTFWLRGDGSDNFGGLQFIWNENYALRYDYAFPLKNTNWHKVTVAWRDLVPALPAPNSLPIDAKTGNAPSKLSQLWIGKWWYWNNYPPHSFAIDNIRLENNIPLDTTDYTPNGDALARVRAKLKNGQPITIVTMGDSLTSFNHWANKITNWPNLLKAQLKAKYGVETTLVNPAIGGTQLRQNVVLIPQWLATAPEPDLVTIFFGYNDWDAGMRGDMFYEAQKDAVERVRRATRGKADILLITTNPALTRWDTMSELAQAVRRAATDKNTGLADTEKAFHARRENNAALFVHDKTHLSAQGHEVVAQTVLQAITGEK